MNALEGGQGQETERNYVEEMEEPAQRLDSSLFFFQNKVHVAEMVKNGCLTDCANGNMGYQ